MVKEVIETGFRTKSTDALWRPDAAVLTGGNAPRHSPGRTFEARLGYGLPAGPLPGVLTPFGDYGAADGRNRLRLGLRYAAPLRPARPFDLEIATERATHPETGLPTTPTFRLDLRGTLRF